MSMEEIVLVSITPLGALLIAGFVILLTRSERKLAKQAKPAHRGH